jgi:superfamily II DNA or RNA helicase
MELKIETGEKIFKTNIDWDEFRKHIHPYIGEFFYFDSYDKTWRLRTYKKIDFESKSWNKFLDNLEKYANINPSEFEESIKKFYEKQSKQIKEKLNNMCKTYYDLGRLFFYLPIKLPESEFNQLKLLGIQKEGEGIYYFDPELAKTRIKLILQKTFNIQEIKKIFSNIIENVLLSRNSDIVMPDEKYILNFTNKLVKTIEETIMDLKKVKIYYKNGFIYLKFKFLPQSVKEELRNKFSTTYYVSSKEGLKERQLYFIKWDDKERAWIITPFKVADVIEFLQKKGYIVEVDPSVEKLLEDKPSITVKDNITLFVFQKEALKKWIDNGCKGVIVIPTGGGKTFIGLKAISVVKKPTLILVPTTELVEQWIETIKNNLGVKDVGAIYSKRKEIKQITVATYHSASKVIDKIKDKFGLVIYDEVHHVPAKTFMDTALSILAKRRLGLSATPNRSDKNEVLIFGSIGGIVYKATKKEINKEKKLLADLEAYIIRVPLKSKVEYNEQDNIIKKKMIAGTNPLKISVLLSLLSRFKKVKGSIVVFTQYIDQAKKAYNEIVKSGIFKPDEVALLTSKTTKRERNEIFNKLKNGKIKVLVVTTVLDEGVNVPDLKAAIVLSGTGSDRQLIQRIGRIIRNKEGKGSACLIDIVSKGTIEENFARKRSDVIKDVFGSDVKVMDVEIPQ